MAGNQTGIAGKDNVVDISFNNSDWIRFGATRNLTVANSVETADSTAGGTDNIFREVVETFVGGTISWDGVTKTDSRGVTLDRFEAFFYDTTLENGPDSQPLQARCIYVRVTRPKTGSENRVKIFQVQTTSFQAPESGAYDDITTYNFEGQVLAIVSLTDS